MRNVPAVTLCSGAELTVCQLLTMLFFQTPGVNARDFPFILELSAEEPEPL